MSLISTIVSRGRMHFIIAEKGGDTELFIELSGGS